ncbi:hypothetical protein HDU96_009281 [Phlyctochytrium bullatum]|nr:hypothetical protein HDU96_009281 [Phlyctochytrium bullatum]
MGAVGRRLMICDEAPHREVNAETMKAVTNKNAWVRALYRQGETVRMQFTLIMAANQHLVSADPNVHRRMRTVPFVAWFPPNPLWVDLDSLSFKSHPFFNFDEAENVARFRQALIWILVAFWERAAVAEFPTDYPSDLERTASSSAHDTPTLMEAFWRDCTALLPARDRNCGPRKLSRIGVSGTETAAKFAAHLHCKVKDPENLTGDKHLQIQLETTFRRVYEGSANLGAPQVKETKTDWRVFLSPEHYREVAEKMAALKAAGLASKGNTRAPGVHGYPFVRFRTLDELAARQHP